MPLLLAQRTRDSRAAASAGRLSPHEDEVLAWRTRHEREQRERDAGRLINFVEDAQRRNTLLGLGDSTCE
jgi:hypothetical protein